MTLVEREMIKKLTDAVDNLSARVQTLEATINKGRGAYMMFITLLSVIGTGLGIWKLLGR